MALLTPRAAAERLGVGYSTLKRWVRSGKVRTTRTEGGHHRVAEAEIDRLLARQQAPSDAVRALKLRRGEDAIAIIKSTEVMIARPATPPEASLTMLRR